MPGLTDDEDEDEDEDDDKPKRRPMKKKDPYEIMFFYNIKLWGAEVK